LSPVRRLALMVIVPALGLWGLTVASGCNTNSSASTAASSDPVEPPAVSVQFVRPVIQPVAPFEEFGGRTSSPATVELRSRVSGYLKQVNFVDGADVKAGDVLFEIDDSTYSAVLAQMEATVLEK